MLKSGKDPSLLKTATVPGCSAWTVNEILRATVHASQHEEIRLGRLF
jgi:hypothetical protein